MLGLNEDLKRRAAEGRGIRVALIGAGQMGTDIVSQISQMSGIDVVAVADLHAARVEAAYLMAGRAAGDVQPAATVAEASAALHDGRVVSATDYRVLTDLEEVDVVIEATGSPEVGARAALRVLRQGTHLVMMNVEADITVGPLLNWYADHQGVVYTLGAGDEPVALMELYDFADALGLRVVAAGKGKNNPLDHSATGPSLAAEAARRGLTPEMLVEFVDGSKTMIEMAAVANATGLVPDVRGMHGPSTTIGDLGRVFSLVEDGGVLTRTGVVDFAIGPVAPGVFLIATTSHPRLRECLVLRDMGPGPNYVFFRPYHLCSMEVPLSAARAVIHRRTTMAPGRRLVAEVFAVAKTDLEVGDTLEGIGGRHFYSLIDEFGVSSKEHLLPVGIAKGSRVVRQVPRDRPITYRDIELPTGSTVGELRRLQDAWSAGEIDNSKMLTLIEAMTCGLDEASDDGRFLIGPTLSTPSPARVAGTARDRSESTPTTPPTDRLDEEEGAEKATETYQTVGHTPEQMR